MPSIRDLCAAHQEVLREARRYARNSDDRAEQILKDFRVAQGKFESIIDSPAVVQLLDDAISRVEHLHPHDDVSQFIADFLTVHHFNDEVKLSCFHGIKRSEVANFISEIETYSQANSVKMPALTAAGMKDQFTNACNVFVQVVAASRTLEKREKKRAKITSYKILVFSSMAVISGVANAPVALTVLGAISFGITGSAVIAAAQYGAELME